MTTPTTKKTPKLIHHPSTVLDDLCARHKIKGAVRVR